MKKSLRCICAAIFMLVFCTGFVIHASAVERASLYLTRYSATVSASNNGTIEIKIFVVANTLVISFPPFKFLVVSEFERCHGYFAMYASQRIPAS